MQRAIETTECGTTASTAIDFPGTAFNKLLPPVLPSTVLPFTSLMSPTLKVSQSRFLRAHLPQQAPAPGQWAPISALTASGKSSSERPGLELAEVMCTQKLLSCDFAPSGVLPMSTS